ncbi:MAG: hypothetical protein IKA06_02040, partial [Clostridia bacterium]|nr:hypothetical protein [Clostridia bacterium]
GFEKQISASASGNFLVISPYYCENSPRIYKYLLSQNSKGPSRVVFLMILVLGDRRQVRTW